MCPLRGYWVELRARRGAREASSALVKRGQAGVAALRRAAERPSNEVWRRKSAQYKDRAMNARMRVRRARRDDLDRVRALLGAADVPTPRERKRWRRLVSTLGEDLYLAERDDALVGLAVIVYVRGLGAPAAIVRQLHA